MKHTKGTLQFVDDDFIESFIEDQTLLASLKHIDSVIDKGFQIEKNGGFHTAIKQEIKNAEYSFQARQKQNSVLLEALKLARKLLIENLSASMGAINKNEINQINKAIDNS